MWIKFLCAISLLFVSACGIDGEPIAPAEIPVKEKVKPKLSEIDPMTAEGVEAVEVTPLENINALGADYDSHFEAETHDLDEMFERLKPASAQPKKSLKKAWIKRTLVKL